MLSFLLFSTTMKVLDGTHRAGSIHRVALASGRFLVNGHGEAIVAMTVIQIVDKYERNSIF